MHTQSHTASNEWGTGGVRRSMLKYSTKWTAIQRCHGVARLSRQRRCAFESSHDSRVFSIRSNVLCRGTNDCRIGNQSLVCTSCRSHRRIRPLFRCSAMVVERSPVTITTRAALVDPAIHSVYDSNMMRPMHRKSNITQEPQVRG
jgi:hypothetical protein